jgi:hypothetical protein
MVKPNSGEMKGGASSVSRDRAPDPRITGREVVAVRLGAAERTQIASAAERAGRPLSSFVREAALAVSAIELGRVSPAPKSEGDVLPALESGGEPVEPPGIHFVDGDPVPALPRFGG